MNQPAHPDRLRLTVAPGSPLAVGLSAARMRAPTEAQLRALEASMAATLGAAAMGAAARAADGAEAASATPALLSNGTFKVTAALLALAAAGGAIAYRHARQATPAAMAAAPSGAPAAVQQGDRQPSPELSLPPQPATVPAVPPAAAGAERLPGGAGAPHPSAGRDALAVIVRAQRLLVNDPAAAFALVEGERRMLAQSAFAQEAEVIAVGAMVRLGRTDEASARAARFVARFPGSVHAARMRRVAEIIK